MLFLPVQSPQVQRAKSPRENGRRNIKSDEGNDIQDIVDVRKTYLIFCHIIHLFDRY
jgi:hypothetical protein